MRLSLLSRYLLRQNLFTMAVCVGLGSIIYLLTDIFDRLDDFLEAGLGAGAIASYFGLKIPLIFSQILPAVFLIALVIQLGLLARNRELLALQAGGISYGKLAIFFVAYATVWSVIQLGFAQVFGVYGEQATSRIWAEQVRHRTIESQVVRDVWFREGNWILTFRQADVRTNTGQDVVAYELSADHQAVVRIVTAKGFQRDRKHWTLEQPEIFHTDAFATEHLPELILPLKQGLEAFAAVGPQTDPAQQPVWRLVPLIKGLRQSGSNVEILRTVLHGKFSYAFSILAMALLALAVSSFGRNLYVNITASLVATFLFYGFYMVGMTLGQRGVVPAFFGAWLGNVVFGLLAVSRLLWVVSKE